MAEMCDPKEPGDPEEEMFGGQRTTKKYTGLLRSSRSLPGCLTQAHLPLLLLLISLGFFMLLVTTLVQVSRIRQSLQKETWDHQENPSQVDVSQKRTRSDLDEILQQLTWMNATLAGLCRPCPWKWELFQESCYFFSQTQNTWKESISACQNLRAQLVIINSTEEQKFLKSWNTRNNQRTWIGLSDHHNEGSWKWVDNTPLQLSFWKEGEPNNHGDEDCVELYSDGWNDNRCSTENFWICKKPSSPCPGP
ncbi:CD209 antigen-like protein C isoform X1 [Canis lupus baileyi]|uniref:CD209 molecule n=3 Tax=Canis lupus familiaris TaxID=9615 RepID=A0A8C0RTC5_CANLF|nr:CD209 antigen-like protein 2 isoform X1 [Canis lupus dingo]